MKYFWLSWYHPPDIGQFEIHTPWWISGTRCADEADTICAAVVAENEAAAKELVRQAYDDPPEDLEWRFCSPQEGEPFTDRFKRTAWMVWPPTAPPQSPPRAA